MRVLVCGSRYFNDYKLLSSVLSKISISVLIHGGARGADTLAGEFASRYGIPQSVFLADWTTFGKRAGPIRNQLMLDEGKPELVVAFWDGESRGTKHMIDIAEAAGVGVNVIYYKNCE